jgi:hypothetical protein
MAILFEDMNAPNRQMKPEKTASSQKMKSEWLIPIEIYIITSTKSFCLRFGLGLGRQFVFE